MRDIKTLKLLSLKRFNDVLRRTDVHENYNWKKL